MAASNYMTEADTEAIWDVALTTARFALIGVRIAEQLNFWVYDDATNQVTNVAVMPIMEQLSEEILLDLIQASKSYSVEKPWDFIQANVARISTRILRNYDEILDKIKTILGSTKMELTSSHLPSSTTNW